MIRPRLVALAAAVFVVVLVLVALVARSVSDKQGPDAVALAGDLKVAAGKVLVGTAVDDTALRNEFGYQTDLAEQFSTVTPENAMKWSILEPERGKVDWSGADRLVDFAERSKQVVRGHPLVWFGQLPGWVQALRGPEVQQVMREHIRALVGRYGKRVGIWDVVNEPFEDDGTRRQSVFQTQIGDGWIEDAFRTARAGNATAKLYLNEIGAEAPGRKSDALYALVKQLKAAGVPIDGVGFQGHFSEQGVPDGFRENLQRFAALGLDVAVTESDVALQVPAGAAALRKQARIFSEVVKDCLAVPRCRSITFWGFTDRHSWIPATQPGRGAATLLDDELRPKPAYDAVLAALRDG